jgi:hypothetical protein
MKNFFKSLFAISAAIIAVSTSIIIIYTYWDRIKSCLTTCGRIVSNIANTFSGDGLEKEEEAEI